MAEYAVDSQIYSKNNIEFQTISIDYEVKLLLWHKFPNALRGEGILFENRDIAVISFDRPDIFSRYPLELCVPGEVKAKDYYIIDVSGTNLDYNWLLHGLAEIGCSGQPINPAREETCRLSFPSKELTLFKRGAQIGYLLHRFPNQTHNCFLPFCVDNSNDAYRIQTIHPTQPYYSWKSSIIERYEREE